MIATLVSVAIVFLLVAADQISKYLIASNFELGESVHVIKGLLDFTYVQNKGAAFGILENHRWVFLVFTVVLLAVIAVLWAKGYATRHFTGRIATVLVMAGGIGNMIDRLALGYVVDFLDISPLFSFAVFNVADCCATVGVVFMAAYILFFFDKGDAPSGKLSGGKEQSADSSE